jgi:hypothetical protein
MCEFCGVFYMNKNEKKKNKVISLLKTELMFFDLKIELMLVALIN